MSCSGIEVNPEVNDLFEAIRSKKKHKFAFIKMNKAQTEFVIDTELFGPEDKTTVSEDQDRAYFRQFADYLNALKRPSYAVFDLRHNDAKGVVVEKLISVFWSPDGTAGVREKMLYSSSRDYINAAFKGTAKNFQINDTEELDFDEIVKQLQKRN